MSYMLDERFCILCSEPLHGQTGRCPACGQKTTPISLAERLRADGELSRHKNAPFICALVIAVACLFHLAWCCIGGLTLYRKINAPAPVRQSESVSVPTFSLDEEQQKKQERIAQLMERALDYEDPGEFVAAFCSSHTQEDMKYYYGIWNNAWTAKHISDSAAASGDPFVNAQVAEKSPDDITVLGFAGRTGIIIAALEAVMTLGNLYYCIRCLLGADDGWARLVGFCSEHLKTMLFTGDIPAWAALLCAVITMSSLNEKLGGERLKRSRQRRIFKAKQEGGIADRDVWMCECGFVNKRIDSECVSCGRYKPLPAGAQQFGRKRIE